ncbi:TPA: hypothetical protein ACGOUU_002190, partial [Streptococcus suis]
RKTILYLYLLLNTQINIVRVPYIIPANWRVDGVFALITNFLYNIRNDRKFSFSVIKLVTFFTTTIPSHILCFLIC